MYTSNTPEASRLHDQSNLRLIVSRDVYFIEINNIKNSLAFGQLIVQEPYIKNYVNDISISASKETHIEDQTTTGSAFASVKEKLPLQKTGPGLAGEK